MTFPEIPGNSRKLGKGASRGKQHGGILAFAEIEKRRMDGLFSIEELAGEAGISAKTYNNAQKKRFAPSRITRSKLTKALKRLCDAAGVSP